MLLDSNIVIYAFDPAHDYVSEFLRGRKVEVSVLTRVEVMGFWRLTEVEYGNFRLFFEAAEVLPVTPEVAERAIALRRQRKVGLVDAIIAATALVHGLPLATHNLRDFAWIEGLDVIDPVGLD